nr:hypothetical protein [Tanacetum cinerariifolium]
MAFLSSPISTNKADTASIQVTTVSTPVSTVSSHDNTANLSDATVFKVAVSFVENESKKVLLANWECRSSKNQEIRPRNQDSSRKTMNMEDTSFKAMVAIDGVGYGPKDSKSVCVDTSNEIKKAPHAPIIKDWVSDSDEDENFAPTVVLTKSGIVPIRTARHSSSRAAAAVSAARPLNTAASKPLVNVAKPRQNCLQHHIYYLGDLFTNKQHLKTEIYNVNTAKANSVNTAKGNKVASDVGKQGINAVKSLACWVWRPKIKVQNHVSKNSGSYICKRFDYVDPEGRLKSVMAWVSKRN